ncbi:hypothetical protein FN846DRAFT_993889 [Sphaerosporella brunnea]|uniref:Fungal-type protein kinase domain-containing protein n=1 Tax=Sphaerosporella brunnea TaxID=1250544 RepID=A0A5J5ELN9_9PEZI|nr:hypothetical protein FN846DRAFT_993889 [Sphaerosporella brunnea]
MSERVSTSQQQPLFTDTNQHLHHTGEMNLQKRVKTRTMMSAVGIPLLYFSSYKHLLLALRDAIRGHRYLYTEHNIVHRNISRNNLLLCPNATPPEWEHVGTPYTAIQDLESFYYVLLDNAIHYEDHFPALKR